jgi:hypothetical protein
MTPPWNYPIIEQSLDEESSYSGEAALSPIATIIYISAMKINRDNANCREQINCPDLCHLCLSEITI